VTKKVSFRIEAENLAELEALIKIIAESPRIEIFAATHHPDEVKPSGHITIQYEDGDDPN
jgi:hypothetical protein